MCVRRANESIEFRQLRDDLLIQIFIKTIKYDILRFSISYFSYHFIMQYKLQAIPFVIKFYVRQKLLFKINYSRGNKIIYYFFYFFIHFYDYRKIVFDTCNIQFYNLRNYSRLWNLFCSAFILGYDDCVVILTSCVVGILGCSCKILIRDP